MSDTIGRVTVRPTTKAERLAAEIARSEAYLRYVEAWDALAKTTNGTVEDERARAAVVEAERAQAEAEKRLQAIEAEVEITEADLQAARLTDMGGE